MNEDFLKFKIDESGYLLYSLDGGCTWKNAGKVVGDASIVPGPAGQDGQTGATGADGQDGQDGFSPYIDETTGNWVDANGDTGVKAAGLNANVQVASSADIASVGTPSVTIVRDTVTNTATLQFHNLKGVPGKYVHFKASSSECTDIDDAYIDSDGNIQVLTSFVSDTPVFTNSGNIKGPKGDQGEHGIPGEGVHFKPNAAGCEDLNDGYIDANGHLIVVTSKDTSTTPATLTFTDYGSLIGPQGATGAAGPKGDQGNPLFFNNSGTVYDAASGQMIFAEAAANEGDYLIYTGSDLSIAPKGQLFRYVSTVGTTKIWEDQHFNICMLASNGGMDLDTLVNILRGYPLYAEGDGINIVPNVTGEFEIKVNVDNNTIKFDSQGRIYATGGGGGGTTYTAGDGIVIDGSTLSAKIDNETIVADEDGTLFAVQPIVNTYTEGDGISIIGSGTQKTVAAKVDDSTIKIDSSTHKIKGNYSAGEGLALDGTTFSFVENILKYHFKSGSTDVSTVIQAFLGSLFAKGTTLVSYTTIPSDTPFYELAKRLVYTTDRDAKRTYHAVMLVEKGEANNVCAMYLPVSIYQGSPASGNTTNEDCLIAGWGIQSTAGFLNHDAGNAIYRKEDSQQSSDNEGLSPALYCMHIKKESDDYKYACFVIDQTNIVSGQATEVGIWGGPVT